MLYFHISCHILQLSKKPLTAAEFIPPLAKIDPIYKEEEEAFKVPDLSITSLSFVIAGFRKLLVTLPPRGQAGMFLQSKDNKKGKYFGKYVD